MPRGNVEILAYYDDIIKYLNDGNTYRGVYNILSGMNKITISYQRFCDLLRINNIKKKHIDSIQEMIEEAKIEYNKRMQSLSGLNRPSRKIAENPRDNRTGAKHQTKTNMQKNPEQSSQEGKPLFEIKRLGDEAFE